MTNPEMKWMKEACEKWKEQNDVLIERIHELHKKKMNAHLSAEEIEKINFEIDELSKKMCCVEHPINND